MKNKKGATLIEIMIAIILLSILVAMVSKSLVSAYKMSALLIDVPNEQSKALDAIEREKNDLMKLVKSKGHLENRLTNTGNATLRQQLQQQINDVDAQIQDILKGYTKKTITLFNEYNSDGVDVYYFTMDHTKYDITYYASVVDPVPRIRPVPIVSDLTIKVGENTSFINYQIEKESGVLTARADVSYEDVNKEYLYKTSYQWYISSDKYHAVQFANGESVTHESLYSTILPLYSDFEQIVGETKSTLELKDEYKGKMVMCVATPLSKNGAFGESFRSNYIYLNDLPLLTNGSYNAVLDASLQNVDYINEFTDSVNVGEYVYTTVGTSNRFSSRNVKINLFGEKIGRGYSRYYKLESSSSIKDIPVNNNTFIIVVAKDVSNSDCDFISLANTSLKYGFNNNAAMYEIDSDNHWDLILIGIESSGKINITGSYGDVNIAELIVYTPSGTVNADEIIKIEEYLRDKYLEY